MPEACGSELIDQSGEAISLALRSLPAQHLHQDAPDASARRGARCGLRLRLAYDLADELIEKAMLKAPGEQ